MTRKPHGAAALWAVLLFVMLLANGSAVGLMGYSCEYKDPSDDSALGRVCAWDDPNNGVITMTPAVVALIPFWLLLVAGPLALLSRRRRVIAAALIVPYALLFTAWVVVGALPAS